MPRSSDSLLLVIGLVAVALLWASPLAAEEGIETVLISRSGDVAEMLIRFACPNRYVLHSPTAAAARTEITLMRMDRCAAGDDSIREATRPAGRALALLEELEYEARGGAEALLRLRFERAVDTTVTQAADLRSLRVTVRVPPGPAQAGHAVEEAPVAHAPPGGGALTAEQRARAEARALAAARPPPPPVPATPLYVVNLRSATTPIDPGEAAGLVAPGRSVYVADITVEEVVWHRLRLGFYATETQAEAVLGTLRGRYPDAWVTRVSAEERLLAQTGGVAAEAGPVMVATPVGPDEGAAPDGDLLELTRSAVLDGDLARAIELAIRALGDPEPARAAEARELLGLARERNGQVAHAVAEYRRYLADYPDSDGASRVGQRLATLTTAREPPKPGIRSAAPAGRASGWDAYGGVAQYYRRDSIDFGNGQATDLDMLFSDADLVVRRSGERFDFGARTTFGYDYDLTGGDDGPGSQARVYNAFIDLEDNGSQVSGRLGRQTLRNQGVLGRFDGALVSWQFARDYRLNLLSGFPVYQSADGVENSRLFYGLSLDILELFETLDANVFFNIQDVDGVSDRQAVGGELRYFAENRSLITAVDFDLIYSELNSLIALGNWTFDNRATVNAMFDWRRTPYLTTENALIGQGVSSIDELLLTFTEDEIRRLAADRTGSMQTLALGVARPVGERFQVSADVTVSQFDGTPASGGVPATPDGETEIYYYLSLIGSSLLTEGDVSIFGLRYADGSTARTVAVFVDSRYPLTQRLRLNPRLLVSRREITTGDTTETLLRPGLRLLYRMARNYQFELDAGGEFGSRDAGGQSLDTSGYYLYVGYRADF